MFPLYFPGCAFQFELELFSWHLFMNIIARMICVLPLWKKPSAQDFNSMYFRWLLSFFTVVCCVCLLLCKQDCFTFLISEPVFLLLRISQISKNTEFTYYFVTAIHVATVGEALCLLWSKWWTSHGGEFNCWLLSHGSENSCHS